MAKPKLVPAESGATRAKRAPRRETLGAGLHAGVIELRSGGAFQVRLPAGGRCKATLDDEVDPALAEECLRSGRRVVLCDGERGPVIVGALQTSAPVVKTADGAVTIEGRELRLKAKERVVIDTGATSLRMAENGAVRFEGEKMVIDMPALVRILAASVELP